MAKITDGSWKLGGLAKRRSSPGLRNLIYTRTTPFKKALPDGEADQVIQVVRGTGLQLERPPEDARLALRGGSRDGAVATTSESAWGRR